MSEAATAGEAPAAGRPTQPVVPANIGGRGPAGAAGKLLAGVALAWSAFQLWIASPLPFLAAQWLPVLNDTQIRSIHLAFAVFLAFTVFPARKRSPRERIPPRDWAFALLGAFCAAYLFLFYAALAAQPGRPTGGDLWAAGIGMLLLLEAVRRSLGLQPTVLAVVCLAYLFVGDQPFVPEAVHWQGASLSTAMSRQWLSAEGVFGVALGASASFVFLFALFVALLRNAGAGRYFLEAPFALLGHLPGGAAQSAVLSSVLTGQMSGSSITEVTGAGARAIPLMRRAGVRREQAGAVMAAAATNAQLTPPVMGAAAFLMVEYVGISYLEVIKHAFLPAVLACVALVYAARLDALKAGGPGLPRTTARPVAAALLSFALTVLGLTVLTGAVYYGLGWIKDAYPEHALTIVLLLILAAYLGLLWYATRQPAPPGDEPGGAAAGPPRPGPTVKSGLYFLLPVAVLAWCLTVERLPPGGAAFWATLFAVFIVATQRPLQALFRGGQARPAAARGLRELLDGLVSGARSMIGIGIGAAAAGIVVGTVALTGIGPAVIDLVAFASGGNLIVMLLLAALMSLILGAGLPTVASYIVVATVVAPAIVALGAQSGLIVPLIAVHLFVFTFGILADDTPPAGLAAFAAAAIARGGPFKTGLRGVAYDVRTAVLPFLFVFNTELLLIDVTPLQAVAVIGAGVVAMLSFAAGTRGVLLVRSRIWESLALLLVAFTLLRPGFWLDMVRPPVVVAPPERLIAVAGTAPAGTELRLRVEGRDPTTGKSVSKTVALPLGPAGDGTARLARHAGLEIREADGEVLIDYVVYGSPAGRAGLVFGWQVTAVGLPVSRPPKEMFYVPALSLLALICYLQRRRRPSGVTPAAGVGARLEGASGRDPRHPAAD